MRTHITLIVAILVLTLYSCKDSSRLNQLETHPECKLFKVQTLSNLTEDSTCAVEQPIVRLVNENKNPHLSISLKAFRVKKKNSYQILMEKWDDPEDVETIMVYDGVLKRGDYTIHSDIPLGATLKIWGTKFTVYADDREILVLKDW